ncbi:MAG: hypothetical protein Q8Q03_01800 [bacterium]|nr:hypothetical protein [bacterium]
MNIGRADRGYTLLFAVLVSALVLAIGISILAIAKKEFLLATSARDSSSAFYAADSGIECAAYGEWVTKAFDLDDDRTSFLGCNFNPVPSPVLENIPNGKKFTFDINVTSANASGGPCASIVITKIKDQITGIIKTSIDSRGYNTGWSTANGGSCSISNADALLSAKRVERAIQLRY